MEKGDCELCYWDIKIYYLGEDEHNRPKLFRSKFCPVCGKNVNRYGRIPKYEWESKKREKRKNWIRNPTEHDRAIAKVIWENRVKAIKGAK